MFYQLLFIHLFRPFLKYKQTSSPLPAHVSPRKLCTHAAATISKLLRLYKRTYGLRQIVNLAVYIAHTACTIHLLNLPEKNAVRDIVHGLKHLEEIADGWLCARKTLRILSISAQKWNIELPDEAAKLLVRTDAKYAAYSPMEQASPKQGPVNNNSHQIPTTTITSAPQMPHHAAHTHYGFGSNSNGFSSNGNGYFSRTTSPASSPEAPRPPTGYMHLPLHSTTEASKRPPRSQQSFLPQAQQELWNRDRAARAGAQAQNEPSPSVLFGGVDALVEVADDDNAGAGQQDYWLQRDTGSLFANWNGGVEGSEVQQVGSGNGGYFGGGYG